MLNQVQYRKTLLLLITLFIITVTTVLFLEISPISSLIHARTESVKEQIKLANTLGNSKEIIIHRYSAPPHDQVNSYWIETDEGVIIIDAQRFLSQARYLADEILMVTNKPLLGILITHHHTDHLGGLPALVEAFAPDMPIYASQFVHDDIETDGYGFLARRKELHGNDFPAPEDIPLPNQIVADGDKIELGGLTFEAIEFQDNESPVSTIYYLPEQNALFVGDFVTNKRIPFLRNKHSENWLAQLQMLLDGYPEQIIYSGHGEPDSAQQLIENEIGYIETLRSLVATAIATDSEITSPEKNAILTEMEQRYPNYNFSLFAPGLLEVNIDAVAEEINAESN